MNKVNCDEVSRWCTSIKILGFTAVVFLILVSISGSVPFTGIQNFGGNNASILNKSDEAIKAYDKAIEINPQNSAAWDNKGLALDHLNKLDEAIIAYNKAIELDSHNSKSWYGKGIALGKLGKSDEATAAFDKAIELNSLDSMAWNGKGNVLSILNKYDEAIRA